MTIEWTYWIYATIQSMLAFTCVASCVLFSLWSWWTSTKPRPELWAILPLSVWTHAAIGVMTVRWIIPRATDLPFAVRMLHAVSESQSYTGYALTSAALLGAVGMKVAKVWTVRRWSMGSLVVLFGGLLIVSMAATIYHERQIARFCAGNGAACRVSAAAAGDAAAPSGNRSVESARRSGARRSAG
jgi:hypothetical protein